MLKVRFGVYGSGWRAEFFLRVAKALPERFECIGVITRSDEKAERYQRMFGVKCYKTADDFLAEAAPAFVVVSVAAAYSVDVSLGLLEKGIPVLMETPPAPDIAGLERFLEELPKDALIQIAEQYPFHPMHKARLAFLAKGKIGDVQHVQISYTHGFHGVALIRKYLGIGLLDAKVTAVSFPVNVLAGFTREGEPTEERMVQKTQTVALLDFGGKTGLYNFETDQHRSWARSPIIQAKGTHGEVFGNKIKYLKDYKTPIESEFIRKDLGREDNFEGYDLKGVFADGEWLYKNPYCGSRLVDDEIAVAECMEKMVRYVEGAQGFYDLNEAAHDLRLSILIQNYCCYSQVVGNQGFM